MIVLGENNLVLKYRALEFLRMEFTDEEIEILFNGEMRSFQDQSIDDEITYEEIQTAINNIYGAADPD